MKRELAAAADVEPSKMRREDLITREDMQALINAAAHQCKRCHILDGDLDIQRIRRVARGLKARGGLDLIVLDYDELIEAPGRDENEQLRRLVRTAKSIGMELNCAVILISQLRKEFGIAHQDTRPPSLSRIYGTGAKIKHAGIVIFADRKWEENLDSVTKDAVLWVLKNRDGRTGPIRATFNIAKLRFDQAPDPGNESVTEDGGGHDPDSEFDFDERGQPWPKRGNKAQKGKEEIIRADLRVRSQSPAETEDEDFRPDWS